MANTIDWQALQGQRWQSTGGELGVDDLLGQWTVIYFYPKDATPGCTTEGRDFTAAFPDFAKLNARIFGVSRDSLTAHQRFKEKQGFTFDLISDADESLCRAFDVIKEKTLFGKKGFGIERTTFLLDPQGKVVKAWRKVKVPGHVDEVLAALTQAAGQ